MNLFRNGMSSISLATEEYVNARNCIRVHYVLYNICPYKVSQIFDLPGGYVKAFGEGQCYI